MIHRVRMSAAQVGALECRTGGGLGPHILWAWDRRQALVFPECIREALWDELNEASNGEDAHADNGGGGFARRAAASLACVAGKVLRSGVTAPG